MFDSGMRRKSTDTDRMKLEFETIVKVEETRVGNESTSNDQPIKIETLECTCNKCERCAKFRVVCKEIFAHKMKIPLLEVENQELEKELKEKEKNIETYILRNGNLKKECKNLFSRVCILNQEKHNLLNEIQEVEQKLRGKELSLEYQTVQLNNCKAEYSKINQQYKVLQEQLAQTENLDLEPGNLPSSSSSVQRGINKSSSPNGTGSVKTSAKSDVQSCRRRILGVSGVNDESTGSTSSLNSSLQNLQRGQNTSPYKKEPTCPVCFKTFSRPCALASHIRIHANKRSNGLVSEDEVSDQEMHTSTLLEFQCPICLKVCLNACGLANHQRFHFRSQQKNLGCEGSNGAPNNSHEKQVSQSGMALHCEKCGMKFSHQQEWQDHQQLHRISRKKSMNKRFACKKCNKTFGFPYQLKRHLKVHTAEKPSFRCEVCSKKFIYRGSLFQHTLLHGINKDFQCVKCKYSFTNKAHLEKHMQVHHVY